MLWRVGLHPESQSIFNLRAMKRIELTPCEYAIVDDEDYNYMLNFKWRLSNERGHKYAVTTCGRMHRIIMKITDSKLFVDHINHNGLDNRRDNLRICTHSENVRNKRKCIDNTTGYKGVNKHKSGSYYASCKAYNVKLIGKCHKSPYYAALDYNDFAKKLHGEFACLNEITFEDKVKMFYRGEIQEFPKRDSMS